MAAKLKFRIIYRCRFISVAKRDGDPTVDYVWLIGSPLNEHLLFGNPAIISCIWMMNLNASLAAKAHQTKMSNW